MNALRTFVKRHPLVTFFVIAYSFTWVGWTVPDIIYTGTLLTTLLVLPFFLMMAGPLLAAIIVTALTEGKVGVKRLLRKFMQWRVSWRWYAIAFLLGPTLGLVATYLNRLWGAPDPTAALLSALPNTLLFFAIRLVLPFDGPMQEELGWRGYALPRLQERHSPLVANLILGVLVAGWHLPLVFQGKLPLFALLGTIAFTIVFGWIYNNTQGSVLLVLITHAADGLIQANFVGADLTRFFILYIAALWGVVLVVLVRYGPSLGRKPVRQEASTVASAPVDRRASSQHAPTM